MNFTLDIQEKTISEVTLGSDIDDKITRVNSNTLMREITVKPTMCGHNSLLVGKIGDWTWDSVSHLCDMNTFTAKDSEGNPTYLSFYYYQILGTKDFHLQTPSFGDRLQVVSSCFSSGSESILTVHRISAAERNLPPTLTSHEVLHNRVSSCLYIQNFNRWIQKGEAGNTNLYTASPEGFNYKLIPEMTQEHSPRLAYDIARRQGVFPAEDGYEKTDEWIIPYDVNMARDLNGVGLLYFASYFSIVDTSLAKIWLQMGRGAKSYFNRVINNQRVCFLGNTEAGARLAIKVCRHEKSHSSESRMEERYDIEVCEEKTQRRLAIVAIDFLI